MYTIKQKLAFMSKLQEDENGCHIWTGAKKPTGYGNLSINSKYLIAHRVAWEMNNGKIPKGLLVLHSCDNPSCCNPMHLFLGTNKQNTQDMIQKKRYGFYKNRAKGEKNGNSKLNREIIEEILVRYKNGETQESIGIHFGVSQTAISNIILGKTWRK